MPIDMIAYKVSDDSNWTIAPAPATRDWMDATPQKFAYRCLPLAMANQGGWVIGCPLTFNCVWDGGSGMEAIKFSFKDEDLGPNRGQIRSHFGSGILTFSLPWLFRTSPGYGLWVHGASNTPKDGIVALEGLVETDWAPYTFTMNWKLMRRKEQVWFKKGEPIAMVTPFPLALLEDVQPRFGDINQEPKLLEEYRAFVQARSSGLKDLFAKGTPFWEKSYMKGTRPDGTQHGEHRSRFSLNSFAPKAT